MLESLFDRLTRASLRFKWVTIGLSVLALIAGVFALTQLKQELIPGIEFPQSVVIALNPGMGPESLRDQVTIPIEQAVRTVDGVVNIESTTAYGMSIIIARNEFGVDQEALRADLREAVEGLSYPEGMETPELLAFSLSDLPIAFVSVSSPGLSLTDLKELIDVEVIPALKLVSEVADVEVSGGQELPEDLPPQPEPTEAEEPELDPVALPDSWIQAATMQGVTIATTEDLTSEMVSVIASFAPLMLDDLTSDMLLAMPLEALAAIPQNHLDSLDPELQTQIDQRLSSGQPEPVALPDSWIQAAATQSVTLATTADLTPELVSAIASLAPFLLDDLTPEMLLAMPAEALDVLPEAYILALDPDLRTELESISSGPVEVFAPTETINRVDGSPSLGLSIVMSSEANTVSVSHAVFDKLDELEGANSGLRFDVVFEQASFIEESISGVAREGVLGAIFAVVVILIFLSGLVNGRYHLSWRSTLVTAVSIPLSVLMAFALFRYLPPIAKIILDPLANATADIPILGALFVVAQRMFPAGITLNIMTLSGMTVAIGRVVDDSIVVLENIYRHIQRGEDMKQSVLVGTSDVAIAIFASTVTTVVVFLPIGLLGGLVGEFFLPFGVAVSYALASSFLVAVTIVPLLAFLFIRKEHLPPEGESLLQRGYTPILRWALKNRAITLAAAGLLLAGSVFLLAKRPRAFLPDMGEPQITVSVGLPSGTTMTETDNIIADLETALAEIEGLGTILSEIGSSGGMQERFLGGSINQTAASIRIGIEETVDIDSLTAEVREMAKSIVGVDNATISSGALMSSAFGSFAIVLSGNPEQLAAFDDEAITALDDIEGLANVSSNKADVEMILRVDGEPALRYTGELETEDVLGVMEGAREKIESIAPDGITVSEGFETEMQTQGFSQAMRSVLISVLAVYLVMVITFRSFVHPFTILFSLPLAIIGAAAALWLTDRVVGISVLIGLMMLVGIVVTNAIVLINRVQTNRKKRGLTAYEAVVEGGRTRLRPILMTAIAAILALVPLALGLTEGAIIASDLATVVIGGLLTSTLLTLLVVPVMYSLLDQLAVRVKSSPDPSPGD